MNSTPMLEEDSRVPRSKRILLGQLNSNGDCLYATTIAKQIKKDYPTCHLTWAIGSMCRTMIDGNPDVDEVWVIPLNNIGEIVKIWREFEQEALAKRIEGVYDEVFLTQIAGTNIQHYDGSIRSSVLRAYPHPITVSVTPVLNLSSTEVEDVIRFAEFHRLREKAHVILFETSPQTGQSFLTPDFAMELANRIVATIPNSCVVLSSNVLVASNNNSIIDASVLSLRENAELSKYCTLLVGGSSGITWICTSNWAKPLPMVQLLKSDAIWFNSVLRDHEQWGLPTDSIIEMKECSVAQAYECIATVLLKGFGQAKARYHERMKIPFGFYQPIYDQLLREGKLKSLLRFNLLNFKKHGLFPQLIMGPFRGFLYITSLSIRAALRVIKKWVF